MSYGKLHAIRLRSCKRFFVTKIEERNRYGCVPSDDFLLQKLSLMFS
ncbi:MAG: hypothetical protein LBP59_13405 [Planctomycetaceae bacterium]|nr:hypothetical protein [Planctomycetaceae bacterium]